MSLGYNNSDDGSDSGGLTSVIDTLVTTAGSAYIASQATPYPTYTPGQNRYTAATTIGTSSNIGIVLLLGVAVAFLGYFAFLRKG